MKKSKSIYKFLFLLSSIVLSYSAFSLFFFFVLGNVSVDSVIAASLVIFVFLAYKYLYISLYKYIWNNSRTIALHYLSLYTLIVALKKMLLSVNSTYLTYLKSKLFLIFVSIKEVKHYWTTLNVTIVKKYLINNLLRHLYLKLLLSRVSEVNNRALPLLITNNSKLTVNLNLMLSLNSIVLLKSLVHKI